VSGTKLTRRLAPTTMDGNNSWCKQWKPGLSNFSVALASVLMVTNFGILNTCGPAQLNTELLITWRSCVKSLLGGHVSKSPSGVCVELAITSSLGFEGVSEVTRDA
jgi:hypothetical protein